MAKGDPVHIAPGHKGRLHEKLDVPAGKPIPERKLEKADHSKSPAERKEAQFAINASKWHNK